MRLFIAIPLAEQIRTQLEEYQAQLIRRFPDLKLTPREQLHLTLNFIGDADEEAVPLIEEALSGGASGSGRLSFTLGKLGFFPPRGTPRVVWAALDDSGEIARLQAKLSAELELLGFRTEDREFFPHATIARSKGQIDPRKLEACLKEIEIAPVCQESCEVALYSSQLSPSGASHTKIRGFVAGAA